MFTKNSIIRSFFIGMLLAKIIWFYFPHNQVILNITSGLLLFISISAVLMGAIFLIIKLLTTEITNMLLLLEQKPANISLASYPVLVLLWFIAMYLNMFNPEFIETLEFLMITSISIFLFTKKPMFI